MMHLLGWIILLGAIYFLVVWCIGLFLSGATWEPEPLEWDDEEENVVN